MSESVFAAYGRVLGAMQAAMESAAEELVRGFTEGKDKTRRGARLKKWHENNEARLLRIQKKIEDDKRRERIRSFNVEAEKKRLAELDSRIQELRRKYER